jgi:hypothetical protein
MGDPLVIGHLLGGLGGPLLERRLIEAGQRSLQAQATRLAKMKARAATQGRKDDTRRKILIGGYVLALLRDKADEPEAAAIRAGFKTFVEDAKRPDYSQLFSEFFAEPAPK